MANLVDLLAAVDDRLPSESGAFVIDDGPSGGSVLVETRRVCWAAAPGRSARLRELLRRHAERELQDAELEDVFARCRDEHRSLSELLTEQFLVSDHGLRAALKQHTVETLIAQCDGTPQPATWIPHRHRGYHARFTFPPIELLAAAGAELYPYEAEGAGPSLEVVLPVARIGGSFAIGDDDAPVAVCIGGRAVLSVRELLELGEWSAAALAACHGFSPAVMARAIADMTGPAALGWRSARRLVHVAVIDDPGALANAVAVLAQRGLPAVLSCRVPISRRSLECPTSHPALTRSCDSTP